MQAVQVLFQPNVLGASYRFTPLAYRFGGNGFVAKVRHKSSPLTTETTPWIARRCFPFMTMISSCCAVFQNPSFYHGHTTVDDPATRAGRWCCAGPPRHPPPRFVAIVSIMALYPPPPLMAYDRDPPSSHSDVHQRDGCPADRRRGPSTGRNCGLRERTKAKLPARALLRGVSRHRRPSSLPPAQSAPI